MPSSSFQITNNKTGETFTVTVQGNSASDCEFLKNRLQSQYSESVLNAKLKKLDDELTKDDAKESSSGYGPSSSFRNEGSQTNRGRDFFSTIFGTKKPE